VKPNGVANNSVLGIFDSGLGGLTVLRRVRALLPFEDVVYFADQKHVPYGDRSTNELRGLLASNVAYLGAQGVDAIVMGCNTSCAIAARFGWPPSRVPILDLIDAAADAVQGSGARRVGVLATSATARSGAYGDAIRAREPRALVREVAAPPLVPLVESGIVTGPVALAAVAAACAELGTDLDAIVLACSHYPLLDAVFAQVLGDSVLRIDPAEQQAERAAVWVRANAPATARTRPGSARYVTNGSLPAFRAAIDAFAGQPQDGDAVETQRGEGAEMFRRP
jgi:glutamate racemase